MSGIWSRLRVLTRSSPWIVEAAGALIAALALTAAAASWASDLIPLAIPLVGLGLIAAAATVAVRARVHDVRLAAMQRELSLLRLAAASIARETEATARSTRRLEQGTNRAVAAALGLAIPRAGDESATNGAMIAAMIVLGSSRELHFVGELAAYERHRAALESLGPDLSLGRVPVGKEGAYLDRRAQRRRSKAPSLPAFVAGDSDAMNRLIAGDLADLTSAILGVAEYLVVIPPDLRTAALRGGPRSTVESLGDAVILVRRRASPDDPEAAAP